MRGLIKYTNKLQEFLLKMMPYFKGSWLIYSNLFRLLPTSLRYIKLEDPDIILDLSDPPQFSIVKMRNGIVEPALTKFIKQTLREGDIFIDVGANWGYFTCLSSKIVGDTGLVIAIEPIRATFLKLLNTIDRNKLFNVICFNVALSDVAGKLVDFEKPWYHQSTSAFIVLRKENGKIKTLTGDWIVEKINNPEKIKVIA
jgi:FkbM family methyltransferase